MTEWGDVTNDEEEVEAGPSVEVTLSPDLAKEQRMFLDSFKSINKDYFDGLWIFHGNLNGEELLDCINAINNHFEFKDVSEDKKVSVQRLD